MVMISRNDILLGTELYVIDKCNSGESIQDNNLFTRKGISYKPVTLRVCRRGKLNN